MIQPIANNGYGYGRCQSFLASALFCGSMTNGGICHTFSAKMADKMGCLAGNGTMIFAQKYFWYNPCSYKGSGPIEWSLRAICRTIGVVTENKLN